MCTGVRRARRSRLPILITLLLALGGAILTGTAGSASAAAACSIGTYFNGTSCVPAAPGYFVAITGATSETPCPAGTFQPDAGQAACEPATPGHFVATTAATSDTPCAAGTYQPSTGQASCIPASVNHYVPVAGSTAQLACPAGTDQPLTGQTSCVPVTAAEPVTPATRLD